ncbi:MAG TPA: hypothetical protein VK611_16050, partial [Acidimicrobiales bacterium]|nr:hypothetical protein [Acidimicrobiales bacterium]
MWQLLKVDSRRLGAIVALVGVVSLLATPSSAAEEPTPTPCVTSTTTSVPGETTTTVPGSTTTTEPTTPTP